MVSIILMEERFGKKDDSGSIIIDNLAKYIYNILYLLGFADVD